jgi:hypothetical protein
MSPDSASWHLKKHDNGEIFGPVPFGKIVEWAGTAQIAPQDTVSNDGEFWVKAPMVPELKMDWLVRLDDEHFYGPTTIGALMEFRENGEINGETVVIDCCSGTEIKFREAPFYQELEEETEAARSPSRGVIRLGLQKRIRDLEVNLLEKRRQLDAAAETIRKLEARVAELESRLRGAGV